MRQKQINTLRHWYENQSECNIVYSIKIKVVEKNHPLFAIPTIHFKNVHFKSEKQIQLILSYSCVHIHFVTDFAPAFISNAKVQKASILYHFMHLVVRFISLKCWSKIAFWPQFRQNVQKNNKINMLIIHHTQKQSEWMFCTAFAIRFISIYKYNYKPSTNRTQIIIIIIKISEYASVCIFSFVSSPFSSLPKSICVLNFIGVEIFIHMTAWTRSRRGKCAIENMYNNRDLKKIHFSTTMCAKLLSPWK